MSKQQLYFFLVFTLSALTIDINAQIDVTFSVDMNTTAVSSDGVHIAGSFQDWDPSTFELQDPDSDGVYSITVTLENDSIFEYKFINGNSWGNEETQVLLLNVMVLMIKMVV